MAGLNKCNNCGQPGHYALDCTQDQRQNRCDTPLCERPLNAGFVCGRCRDAAPNRQQVIRVAPIYRRPWMRLSPGGKLALHPKNAAKCAEWTANGQYHGVQVFPPTAAFASSPEWRGMTVHPRVVGPCNCIDCEPPMPEEAIEEAVSTNELRLMSQIRELVKLLATASRAHQMETVIETGGVLTISYAPPMGPGGADEGGSVARGAAGDDASASE